MNNSIKFNGYSIVYKNNCYNIYTPAGNNIRKFNNIRDAKEFCAALLAPDEDDMF